MSDAPVEITRRDPLGMITLRCDLADPALGAALARVVGAEVPGVRRFVAGARGAVAWMSPDEVMVFVVAEDVGAVCAALDEALAQSHCLVVDVSDARAVFRLAGPGARRLLAGGAPVDLEPQAFGPGDFRRSRLGQVAAAIWMSEAEVIELMCSRSVAGFVADWLALAARTD